MVNFVVGEMRRLPSLFRRAALGVALSVIALGAAQQVVLNDVAQASGNDDDDGPDWDDDHDDNSGSGNSGDDDWGDWDDDDHDSSGPGSGDDDDFDHDNSGPGSGDDDDDHASNSGDDDDDNSGHGNSGDDDDDGPSGHDDDDFADSSANYLEDHAIYSVEYDSHGDEYTPGEIVFVGAARDLAIALNLGFTEIRVQNLTSGGIMARLGLPPRVDVERATAMLAEATPDAIATPNNIYRSAQTRARTGPARATVRRVSRSRGTMGVIDTGVDAAVFADSLLSQRAFAGPQPVAREHGSVVAAIAVSRGVRVHVADVFGHSTDGALAASAERIAAAIDWMIEHRVPVVNISVEGPNNAILEEMVRRAAERGHIIVAAAGNGGPTARPTFPAAFDGVLAVTAIDETGRPYVRANRGAYIDFAAPGVNVSVDVNGASELVSGTSFAAPIIAAEAAAQLHTPSQTESARVLTRLRDRAEDLGEPGRDNIFGWGALRD